MFDWAVTQSRLDLVLARGAAKPVWLKTRSRLRPVSKAARCTWALYGSPVSGLEAAELRCWRRGAADCIVLVLDQRVQTLAEAGFARTPASLSRTAAARWEMGRKRLAGALDWSEATAVRAVKWLRNCAGVQLYTCSGALVQRGRCPTVHAAEDADLCVPETWKPERASICEPVRSARDLVPAWAVRQLEEIHVYLDYGALVCSGVDALPSSLYTCGVKLVLYICNATGEPCYALRPLRAVASLLKATGAGLVLVECPNQMSYDFSLAMAGVCRREGIEYRVLRCATG